jgi:hypothetical protein
MVCRRWQLAPELLKEDRTAETMSKRAGELQYAVRGGIYMTSVVQLPLPPPWEAGPATRHPAF